VLLIRESKFGKPRLVPLHTSCMQALVSADPISVAVRSIHSMADGDRADFDTLHHPRAVDRENWVQPPSSRVPGAVGFYSTALWLRAGFADLRYDIHHAIADGELVAVNSTMNGRHATPMAFYTDDGAVDTVFPPTGKTFAMTQSPGSASTTARSSNTGPTATTSGRPGNSPGSRRPRPTCSRWRGRRGAPSVLDLRNSEYLAPADSGLGTRVAPGHAPGRPPMETAYVSGIRSGANVP
jgi:SnoaL-like polyketide cyclase